MNKGDKGVEGVEAHRTRTVSNERWCARTALQVLAKFKGGLSFSRAFCVDGFYAYAERKKTAKAVELGGGA